ncbi:ABC-2 transporter permease [Ureibacillus aquaedulcis]|uniref:ABC-2 transporter permease n=1 Tax=Ureibacillus aquaedulcis TaxID=3058421 RepID=A0ABT8GVT5_9BACL|nr:ABC-2 transporter permease [Ureibacillus sp. BA0131]MDN4495528.1 ABC-2 transporter permease [Ureibacillus sp. BA0131]
MFNLIKKDFYLQKNILPIYFLILCFYLWSGTHPAIVIGIVSSIFVINSHYNDEKGKSHILLNSLPYTKKEIVGSKYIGMLVFTTFLLPFVLLGTYITYQSLSNLDIRDILYGYMIITLFTSFYLPFFYRFDQQYILVIFTLIFTIIIVFAKNSTILISNIVGEFSNIVMELNNPLIQLSALVVILIIFGLSWVLSMKVYSKRSF